MPPKKAAGDKKAPEQPEEPPEQPEEAETGKDSPGMFDALAASPGFKKLVLAVTILLITAAVVTIIFFVLELRSTGKLFEAVGDIRNFLVKENYASRTMDDPEILMEAKNLANELSKWNDDNSEVGGKIEDIQRRIKDGWIPFKGHLYAFATGKDTFTFAKRDCEKNDAMIVYVESRDEQRFLVQIVKKKALHHWIGLTRIRQDWTWENGEPLQAPNVYWTRGNPKPAKDRIIICVLMIPCGEEPVKCWDNTGCYTKNPWICKMVPDPKYSA